MRARPRLILYAEDDPDLSALACDLLQEEGFAVVPARHGVQALALLDAGLVPDLVVTDLMMPELDGFGLLAGYRQRALAAPVLAISSFEVYLAAAREAGARHALAKPFTGAQLVGAVRALLGDGELPAPAAPGPDAAAEARRLGEVVALGLTHRAPSEALGAFTGRVAALFGVPICLVSIVGADQQHWHAHCGLPADLAAAGGTRREHSFCTHAVSAGAALVVVDAAENPFFRDNLLVRERGLRFYAGVPLLSRQGHALGTLCLLDHAPRGFGYFDLELLGVLARRVVAELEWRERRERPGAPLTAFRFLAYLDEELDVLGRIGFEEALRVEAFRAAERRLPLSVGVAAVPPETLAAATAALKAALPGALLGRLGAARVAITAEGRSPAELEAALAAACGRRAVLRTASVDASPSARAVLAQLEHAVGDPAPAGPDR